MSYSQESPIDWEEAGRLADAAQECSARPPSLPSSPSPAAASLNDEQRRVLDAAVARQNILLSGSAGTGKSYTLRVLIDELQRIRGGAHRVAVTAPTGIAASHLPGGKTIFAAAGIGVPKHASDFGKIFVERTREYWRQLAVLVVDEVSMWCRVSARWTL